MGSPQVSDGLTKEQISLEATIMALREELMKYFKGSCIGRVANTDTITRLPISQYRQRPRHAYQRRQQDEAEECLLFLGGAPILTIRKHPNTLTFHDSVLGRSKQFQQIRSELQDFMSKYLKSVKQEYHDGPVFYA